MKKASAIVTNRGGRTCHACYHQQENVQRIPAVVGTGNSTTVLSDKEIVSNYLVVRVIQVTSMMAKWIMKKLRN